MTLHLFNPSHDEALAANSPYYYPSTIARRLQTEWGLLPVLWAQPGDCVLVDEDTLQTLSDQADSCGSVWAEKLSAVRLLTLRQLTPRLWQQITHIVPWGWDPLQCHRLRKAGAPESLLPSDDELAHIRQLSSRESTVCLLPQLVAQLRQMGIHAVGETRLVRSLDEVSQALASWQRVVCKSLWSCSGRGVFVIDGATTPSDTGRLRRLLREQGGVEVQKAYDRLLDFALEFSTDGSAVHYLGASAFETNASGGYAGNIVAPQAHIEQQICAALHTDEASLRRIIQTVGTEARHLLAHRYSGPFGIDMMAVGTPQGPALMPCIELNLRRTMGHVALNVAKLTLKREFLPPQLQNLWYFYT